MIVINRLMGGSVGRSDYYKYHFGDKKFLDKVRKNIFNILTEYGKVSTISKTSISNMKNVYISVDIKNDEDVSILVSWGKNDVERQFFSRKLNDIINKNNKDVSVTKLVAWIHGKKKFFKSNPNMLSSRGEFYPKKYIKSDIEYAKLLRQRIKKSKSRSGDKDIFRGISNKATSSNPIEPIYSRKQKGFYEKIMEEVDRLLDIRVGEISIASVNRFCSKHKGNYRYRVIVDGNSVIALKKPEFVLVNEELEKIDNKYSNGVFRGDIKSKSASIQKSRMIKLSNSIKTINVNSLSEINTKSKVLAKLRKIK